MASNQVVMVSDYARRAILLQTHGRNNDLLIPSANAGTTSAKLAPLNGVAMYEYYAAQSAGAPTNYGNLITIRGNTPGATQIAFPWGGSATNYAPFIRTHSDWSTEHTWSGWNQLAFTTSNVASANKLATVRKLWGNNFDGTADVTGNIVLYNGATWPQNQNITCTATANGQEWSFDLNAGSYTGTYWHVWSSKNGASILQCYTDNRHVIIPVHLAIGGYNNTSYALSTSSFICQSWVRTTGATGWYSETYGGGWYMTDTTYVRSYNNKRIYTANTEAFAFFTEGGFASGGKAAGAFNILYNGTWYDCIHNHQNGNLSVDGPGGSLFLSYYRGYTYFGGGTYRIDRNGYFNGRCASADSAAAANLLNINNRAPIKGNNQLEFQQFSGTGSTGWNNSNPTNDWYHHLRFNHANSNGYFVDLAFCFHSENNFIRRIVNGSDTGWKRLWTQGNAVTSAVWNDYAEARAASGKPGQVVYELGDDTCIPTTERLQHFAGIVSDTWGFSQGETDTAKTHIAVAGRVLAYPYRDRNEYKPGDVLCAAPNGTVDIMTREEIIQYPDRIVGTVSCVPDYDEWGGGEGADRQPVKVNGRIWVKVR